MINFLDIPIYTFLGNVNVSLTTYGYYTQNVGSSTWAITYGITNPAYSRTPKVYYCKNMGTGVVTINAPTAEFFSIGGVNTYTSIVLHQNDGVNIYEDGTYWHILNEPVGGVALSSTSYWAANSDIRASVDITGKTGTTTVLQYTNGNADGTYQVSSRLNITALSVANITNTVMYTDETNTGRVATFYPMGSVSPNISVSGVTTYPQMSEVRVKSGTTISVMSTLSGISATFNAGATIRQIR